MTTLELVEKGGIFFEKINEGFQHYKNVTLPMDEKKAVTHFKNLMKEYGEGRAFVDFYYYRLDEDAKEMVDELLTSAQKEYLQILAPADAAEEIIFPLEENLLRIVAKLNAEEMLFSTIYFLDAANGERKRSTWWGNYEKEYVCFMDKN